MSRSGDDATAVFEMAMGMVDRGADLEEISQYPTERECLFAPLTGIEVVRTRVEGSLLIVEARLSINLNSLTIDQVINKRKKLLNDVAVSLKGEVFDELHCGTRILKVLALALALALAFTLHPSPYPSPSA